MGPGNMTIPFKEFPACYRFSQSSIGFALVALAVGGTLLRACPPALKSGVFVVLGVIVFVALLASHYVIVKYPYISLVETAEPDPFSQHFASSGSVIYLLIKCLGLLAPAMIALGIAVSGFDTPIRTMTFVYCVILVGFMAFFIFLYSPEKHPTVSTFVRSTLGLGIVLYPIFAITIFIGALRCKSLLDSTET